MDMAYFYVSGERDVQVADPFGYNLLTIIGNEERLPTL